MNKKSSPYRTFEIKVGNEENIDIEKVSRITFQEAVRDAYHMIACSRYTKKILSIRVLD